MLKTAARQVQESHGNTGLALVLNLGPAWSNEEAYKLFSSKWSSFSRTGH